MKTDDAIGWMYFAAAVASGICSFFIQTDPVWILGFLILSKLSFIEKKLEEKKQ